MTIMMVIHAVISSKNQLIRNTSWIPCENKKQTLVNSKYSRNIRWVWNFNKQVCWVRNGRKLILEISNQNYCNCKSLKFTILCKSFRVAIILGYYVFISKYVNTLYLMNSQYVLNHKTRESMKRGYVRFHTVMKISNIQ